jgi:hypothetical protein
VNEKVSDSSKPGLLACVCWCIVASEVGVDYRA